MCVTEERGALVLSLFESYYDRVYCFIRRSLPPEQAEDIAQELFIRLLEHRDLENRSISVSYLIKIADNLIKRRYQRNKRFQRWLESQNQRRDIGPVAMAASDAPDALDDQVLEKALDVLSPEEQNAVRLIVCQGMSYEAAACSLGVSVTTINNWKYRGLRKLKESVNHQQQLAAGPTA